MSTTQNRRSGKGQSAVSPYLASLRENTLKHVNSIVEETANKQPSSEATHAPLQDDMIIRSYQLRFLNVLIKAMKQAKLS